MRPLLPALLAALAACNSFENPEVVVDFRVLAIAAEPPEQLVEIDLTDPAPPATLLEQVQPTEICALISDRTAERRLRWEMTICRLDSAQRCARGAPFSVIGAGLWADPEDADAPVRMCATIPADGNLLGVALDAFENDALRGLGGVYYGLSLRVGGEADDPDDDLFAAKTLRLQPKIPPEIQANQNPSLDALELTLPSGEVVALPPGRCRDQAAPIEVASGARVRIDPIEPASAREPYLVPTLDGEVRMFTESLTYQWLATAGNYSSGRTGGPRDAFGNPATLWTEWVAPELDDAPEPLDVDLWIIQRDERYGLRWHERCLRVTR